MSESWCQPDGDDLILVRPGERIPTGGEIVFGFAHGQQFIARLIELEVAFGEQPRLLAEAGLQILGAAAEKFRLRGLRRQMLFEFGDAAGEIVDAAALFGQIESYPG